MESNWLQNEFIWKELRAPYIINYDTDYYETLKDNLIDLIKNFNNS